MYKPPPTLSECIAGYENACIRCGAYDDAKRRVKECWNCPLVELRNATLLDELKRVNGFEKEGKHGA